MPGGCGAMPPAWHGAQRSHAWRGSSGWSACAGGGVWPWCCGAQLLLIRECPLTACLPLLATHSALIIWTGALGALLVVRLTNGLHPSKLGLSNHVLFARGPLRWDICFNLCTLRMLSYGMDLHWARCAARTAARGVRGKPSSPPANAALPATLPGSHAALLSFLAYALYPPLYIAGPIMRYSDFLAQQRALSEHGRRRGLWWEVSWCAALGTVDMGGWVRALGGPPRPVARVGRIWRSCAAGTLPGQPHDGPRSLLPSLFTAQTVRYTLRALCDWVCVELLTHTLYFNSLAAHRIGPLYQPYGLRWGAQQAALTGFWVLAFMWAKFATIWRVMRAAALLDGVSAPENMRRCFANNYDMEGFWRGWHSSFNRWLIRYMYVPLGGARTRLASIWLIFLFVALWHDLEVRGEAGAGMAGNGAGDPGALAWVRERLNGWCEPVPPLPRGPCRAVSDLSGACTHTALMHASPHDDSGASWAGRGSSAWPSSRSCSSSSLRVQMRRPVHARTVAGGMPVPPAAR